MQQKSCILGLLITIFILPLLIAIGLYCFQDRMHFKTNYHGKLFQPAVAVSLKKDPLTAHWHLVYIKSDPCDETCQTAISVNKGLHRLLGEKSLRVRTKVIQSHQLSTPLPPNHLALIDPHHNLVLLYPQSTLLSSPQAIFTDLKRLLRVSQIG